MKVSRPFGLCLALALPLVMSWSCLAETVVDKNNLAIVSLADLATRSEFAATLVVRYEVLETSKDAQSLIQIAVVGEELGVDADALTRAEEALLEAHTVGTISHFPPARRGTTGEVRVAMPQEVSRRPEDYFVLFRMVPVHPEGQIKRDRLKITSVEIVE